MKVSVNGKTIENLRCDKFVSKRDAKKFAKELGEGFLKEIVLENDGDFDVWRVYYINRKDVCL